MVEATSKIKGGGTFMVSSGIHGGIILGDNSTRHCFLIRHLITINSFK